MQFRRIPGMTLPMPLVPGTEAMLTPPAAEPVDDEGTGDSWDLDDCAPEGAALEQMADDALAEHRRGETEPMVPDVNAAVLASLKRIERALSAIASTLTGVALLTEVLDRKYDEKYTELRRAHTDLSYRVPV